MNKITHVLHLEMGDLVHEMHMHGGGPCRRSFTVKEAQRLSFPTSTMWLVLNERRSVPRILLRFFAAYLCVAQEGWFAS